MKRKLLLTSLALLALSTLNSQLSTAFAQGTAFTYQGRLNDTGQPTSGSYDFRFRLASDPLGNNYVGSAYFTNGVDVSNGLFTTALDFGAGIFAGSNYWLEVGVRTNNGGSYIVLAPLQALTPAPYAIMANTASNLLGKLPAGQLSGTILNAVLPGSPSFSGMVTAGSFSGNGANVTNVNALKLNGLGSGAFWQLGGNNAAAGQFLGTTDNQALEFRVGGQRALLVAPSPSDSANIIGGSFANVIDPGVQGAVIAGGGTTNFSGSGNRISENFASISGGSGNWIQPQADHSVIGAGWNNLIGTNAYQSVIAGGWYNTNLAYRSVIGGGEQNLILGTADHAVVLGGGENSAGGSAAAVVGGAGNAASGNWSFVGGGIQNSATGLESMVGGGYNNHATAWDASVGGGLDNFATNTFATIPGGDENIAGGYGSTVGGGSLNSATNTYAAISGGHNNTAGGYGSTVGGGSGNSAPNFYAAISGGYSNTASGETAIVAGGQYNTASGLGSAVSGGFGNSGGGSQVTVGGGLHNTASGNYSFVGGGYTNTSSASFATVGGGEANTASGVGSFVGGGGYDGYIVAGNLATGWGSVIGGGTANTTPGVDSVVGGGRGNQAANSYATVPGGYSNTAWAAYSFAAGQQAQAFHQGAFVWADSQNAAFSSTDNDQFLIRAQGGVCINTNDPIGASLFVGGSPNGASFYASGNRAGGFPYAVGWFENTSTDTNASPALRVIGQQVPHGVLSVSANVPANTPDSTIAMFGNSSAFVVTITNDGTIYCKTTVNTSDRNAKENFTPLDSNAVLEKVANLPVTQWNYKEDGAGKLHIGPVAQDFHTAFGLNGADDTHIATVDEAGVALAAIQGLNQKLDEQLKAKDREIDELRRSVAQLQELLVAQTK